MTDEEKALDIKWLQEYAEQEIRYKWGKQIILLLTAYEKEKDKNKSISKLEADLYEANNRINDLLDIVKQKDELIKELCIGIREHDSLEDSICPLTEPLDCHDINKDGTCIDCIIEFYKRGVSK